MVLEAPFPSLDENKSSGGDQEAESSPVQKTSIVSEKTETPEQLKDLEAPKTSKDSSNQQEAGDAPADQSTTHLVAADDKAVEVSDSEAA